MEFKNKFKFYELDISFNPSGYSHMDWYGINDSIPGIICDVCGNTWGSNWDIGPNDVPEEVIKILKDLGSPWPRERKEHEKIVKRIKNLLIDQYPDIKLRPGTRLGPLLAELTGFKVPSFLSGVSDILVPESVMLILQKEGIKGFEVYPVKIMKITRPIKFKQKKPKLFELRIIGRSVLKKKESGIEKEDDCKACGRLTYTPPKNFIHDIEKWDGSDIFRFDYYLFTIVTEKFKQVCEKHNFSNCKFIPMEKMREKYVEDYQ